MGQNGPKDVGPTKRGRCASPIVGTTSLPYSTNLATAGATQGWLKVLRLVDYAPRRVRPMALQQVLFPYHEAWG